MTRAVVIGAGHNGLACAAYLAQAGLEVTVFEARPSVGGCASTVDAIGTRVNVCNCDHTLVRSLPLIEELRLDHHGLRYLDADPDQLALSWTGAAPWFHFHSVERTLEGLRLTHPDEVEGYRRYVAAAKPVADLVVELASIPPSPRRIVRRLLERRGRGVATLVKWSRMSVGAVVRSFFTNEALRAPVITTGPAVWGLSPETPGTGLGAVGYAMRHRVQMGRPAGGSGALPAALAGAVEAAGGEIRSHTRVEEILVEGKAVWGVGLAGGETVPADVVVAAGDPRQALVSWLRSPPPEAASLVERWRRRSSSDGYESKVDAVLAAGPVYRGVTEIADRLGVPDPLVPTTIVSPSVEGIAAAHHAMGRGRVADRPMFFANIPSSLDPAMRPDGAAHLLSLETLFTPYRLAEGWGTSAEPERWLGLYRELAEDGFDSAVMRHRTMTPPDYEREFEMPRGYAPSYSGSPLDTLLGRDRELSRYETPIQGLFLTGAGTFPGAGVWAAAGRNAAATVIHKIRA